MIKLQVNDYCQNCPDFEALVNKNIIECGFDIQTMQIRTMTETIISCENAQRCRSMFERLEQEMKKGEKQNV